MGGKGKIIKVKLPCESSGCESKLGISVVLGKVRNNPPPFRLSSVLSEIHAMLSSTILILIPPTSSIRFVVFQVVIRETTLNHDLSSLQSFGE